MAIAQQADPEGVREYIKSEMSILRQQPAGVNFPFADQPPEDLEKSSKAAEVLPIDRPRHAQVPAK